MKKMLLLVFVCVFSVTGIASSEETHSRKVTVTGWGGPESKVRCDRYVDWGLAGKHCVAHTIQFKQHLITLELVAPKSVDVNQVVQVKDACAAAGAAGAFIGNIPGGIAALEACVEATNIGARLIGSKAKFHVRHESSW